jgi:hypothetical protein
MTVECMLSGMLSMLGMLGKQLGHPVLSLPSSVIHGSMLLAIHSEVTEQYYLVGGHSAVTAAAAHAAAYLFMACPTVERQH